MPGRCDGRRGAGLVRAEHRTIEQRRERRKVMQAPIVQARMNNPVMVIPDALQPLLKVGEAAREAGLPGNTAEMVHLRAAQINGCGYCVDMHARALKDAGEADERIFSVAAWREAPYYTEAERAALALTEAATRLADRPDSVPDGVWEDAARPPPRPRPFPGPGGGGGGRAPPLRGAAPGVFVYRAPPDQLLDPPHRDG